MRSTRMPLAAAAGVTVSIAASMNESGWSGCTSSRSLPELMRLMSSRSSMSCAWTRALRSMVSRPARSSSALRLGDAQHLGPAEDGVQRRAQLVRERGEEVVLGVAHALGLGAGGALAVEQRLALRGGALRLLVEAGVVEGDAGLAGDAEHEPLGPLGEDARVRMPEEQPAEDLA